MAVNGDKTLQTSRHNGDTPFEKGASREPSDLNSANINPPERDSDKENSEIANKETIKQDKDGMPADATKTSDNEDDMSFGSEDDSMNSPNDDESIVVKTVSTRDHFNLKSSKVGNCRDRSQRILTFRAKALRQRKCPYYRVFALNLSLRRKTFSTLLWLMQDNFTRQRSTFRQGRVNYFTVS